jgi:predicted membrane channel-forming protein YqfA (hemolysin III family)
MTQWEMQVMFKIVKIKFVLFFFTSTSLNELNYLLARADHSYNATLVAGAFTISHTYLEKFRGPFEFIVWMVADAF